MGKDTWGSVGHHPQEREGILDGCTLHYEMMLEDQAPDGLSHCTLTLASDLIGVDLSSRSISRK